MNNYFDQNLNFLLKSREISPEDLAGELKISITGTQIYVADLLKLSEYFNISIDQLVKYDLESTLNKRVDIKLLILDVDGVLTTGGMYFTEGGDEMKQFNTKDGRGIISFIKGGGHVGIISSGFKNEIIKSRAKMLGIQHVHVGLEPKEKILEDWITKMNITWSEVAFVGDDINDYNVMKRVGFTACPNDAINEIKEISDVILNNDGGKGCVREFIGNHLCNVTM